MAVRLRVWRWQEGQPAQVVNQGGVQVLPNDAAIAVSGSGATCAATDRGVWCSGRLIVGMDSQEGQLVQSIPEAAARRVACGYNHCCAYSSRANRRIAGAVTTAVRRGARRPGGKMRS